MSIIGFACWFLIFLGEIILIDKCEGSIVKQLGIMCLMALMPLSMVFGLQYIGINMGTWLMYKGVMLIPAGGI